MSHLHATFCFALPFLLSGGLLAQEPAGTHKVKLGKLEVTTLMDTQMQLPTSLLRGVDAKVIDGIYQGKPTVTTPANAFLVRYGKHLVLVDTGGSKAMNPDMGHIQERLQALGVKPESIEAVFITHFHGDHTGGLLTPDGQRAFPNAVIRMSQAEDAYWSDPKTEASLPEARKPMIAQIKATFAPYRAAGKYLPFAAGEAPFPGVEGIPVHGHTPGSTLYVFKGKPEFWAVGDIVHFGAVQFEHPEATVAFDTDSALALNARGTIWSMAAQEGAVLGGAHLAFPGVGHVAAQGQAFKWVPLP